jgi:hypothetical protein
MQHVASKLGRWGLALLPLLGFGCGSGDGRAAPPGGLDIDNVPPSSWQQTGSDPCQTPDVGCPCEEEGVTLDCGTVTEMLGDYKVCYPGTRTCTAGAWGDCTADRSLGGEVVMPAD